MYRISNIVLVLAILAFAVACGDDDPGPVAATTIDESGGVAESDDGMARINFPEGAVGEAAEVTIQRQATPDRDDLRTGLFTFEIDTDLLEAVTVEIDLEDTNGDIVLARYADDAVHQVAGSGVQGDAVVGELDSFSDYGGFDTSVSSGGGEPLNPDDFDVESVVNLNDEGGSFPAELTVAGGQLFFGAEGTESQDDELWVSDGTEAGTEVVSTDGDDTLTSPSNPRHLMAFGDDLLFRSQGRLAITDGTEAGTKFLGAFSSTAATNPRHFTEFKGRVYFAAAVSGGSDSKADVWVTDGTEAGTEEFAVINDEDYARPDNFVVVDDQLFFTALDVDEKQHVWVTDGTEAGTNAVTDFPDLPADHFAPDSLAEFNGELVFYASTQGTIAQLWISDGTASGTREIVVNDNTEHFGPYPYNFFEVGGNLLFTAVPSDSSGRSLWISDGTEAGTQAFHDVNAEGIDQGNLARLPDGRVLFPGTHDAHSGMELWITDGTPGGTQLVKDINPDDSSRPSDFAPFGDLYAFVADDGHGDQLWVTNGSTDGTVMLTADGATEDEPLYHSVWDFSAAELNGALYFPAAYTDDGKELWRIER